MDPRRSKALLEAFKTLADELQQQGFSAEELRREVREPGLDIPATAFRTPLTPLETAARWLSEKGKPESEIAKTLGRPPSAIKRALENGRRKLPEEFSAPPTQYNIPAEIFADKTLTFGEHIAVRLREQGLSNAQIARETGLDPRTVWTLLKRAGSKGGEAR